MVSGTAMEKPSSHMAAKNPRIQAVTVRVRRLARADSLFTFSSLSARLDLTRLAMSVLSCRSASASPANPIAHGNSRARNHHSRASHKVQAKNAITSAVKIGAQTEITTSFSIRFALVLFLFLRHV